MGDYLQFADTQEYVHVTAKSGSLLTIERGCHAAGENPICDGKGATSHHGGIPLIATCTAANLSHGYWWWDFADSPQGEDSGSFWVREEKMNPPGRDECVAREPYDICGHKDGYAIRAQEPTQEPWTADTFLKPPALGLNTAKFQTSTNGSGTPAVDSARHPSMNQAAGDESAHTWFTDQSASAVMQLGLKPGGNQHDAGIGKSRILVSATLAGPPRDPSLGPAVPNVLSDGSWILWRCLDAPNTPDEPQSKIALMRPPASGATGSPKTPAIHEDKPETVAEQSHYCLVKVPSPPREDGINRTELENVPVSVATHPGALKARVKYGYEEYGPRDVFHCTGREQVCDSANLPLSATSTLQVGIPQHVLFYQIEYLNDANAVVGSGPIEALAIP
jgi:hypothetical protein